MAWQLARPNAIVTIVALYDKEQTLPFAVIWQNLTFKTGGVGACDCNRVLCLTLIAGKIDTTHLITHTYSLASVQDAYSLFERRAEGVIKVLTRRAGIIHFWYSIAVNAAGRRLRA